MCVCFLKNFSFGRPSFKAIFSYTEISPIKFFSVNHPSTSSSPIFKTSSDGSSLPLWAMRNIVLKFTGLSVSCKRKPKFALLQMPHFTESSDRFLSIVLHFRESSKQTKFSVGNEQPLSGLFKTRESFFKIPRYKLF